MGFRSAVPLRFLFIAMLAAAALAALAAAPAGAEVRSGNGSDPAGDSAGPVDVTALEASYDEAGTLTAKVTFAADPGTSQSGFITVAFATTSSGGCGAEGSWAAVGGYTSPAAPADPSQSGAAWADDADNSGDATRTFSGTTVTFSATDPLLAGKTFDCVEARLTAVEDTSLVWDDTSGPIALAAPQKPLTRKQKLKRALKKCSRKFAGKRGAAAKKKLKKCRRQAQRRFGKPKGGGKGGSGKGVVIPPGKTLAGATFTYFHYDPFFSNSWDAYSFIDSKWAYRGVPEGGIPRCTRVTAGVDEDGDPTDGCLKYSYDQKKRLLRLDGRRVKVKVGPKGFRKFSFGDDGDYFEAANLRPGARFDAELESVYVFGIPPTQFTSFTWLAMNRAGEFVKSSVSFGSTWDSNFSVVPPDQRGRYQVLSGKRLRLTFADGKVETYTAVVIPNNRTGSAVPAIDGLLLDDSFYIPDDD